MKNINPGMISRLEDIISKASNIAIATHIHPDGDAMGSSIGLKHFLEESGSKTVRIFLSDRWPDTLSFMMDENESKNILICDEDEERTAVCLRSCDTLFCLDFNTPSRSGSLQKHIEDFTGEKILIDHHIGPDTGCFDLCFSETEISSASEYLYHILKRLEYPSGLPAASLDAILTGITTDTNNFANSVFPSTLEACSELLAAGVDRDRILGHIYNDYRENRMRLMGHLLKDVMVTTSAGLAYIILSKKDVEEYGITDGETEGFVNLPLAIKEIRMSVFLREEDGYFRVSIRSKRGVSANRCAREHFNGGGHEQAAGGRLYWPENIRKPEDAATYIENVTKPFLNES